MSIIVYNIKRLDADILAGDMPKEHEALKTEFEQHETLLKDLEMQAEEYKSQGKTDAGERLEQQAVLLKVS